MYIKLVEYDMINTLISYAEELIAQKMMVRCL